MRKNDFYKKVKLTGDEVSIILKLLIDARNERIKEQKVTDDIDSIIIENFKN